MTRSMGLILIAITMLQGVAPAAFAAGPSAQLTAMIETAAAESGVPAILLHRIIRRESNYNAQAYHGGHWGLMQIKYETARSMGYRGPAAGLSIPRPICASAALSRRRLSGLRRQCRARGGALCPRLLLRGQAQGPARGDGAQGAGEAQVSRSAHIVLAHPEPLSYNAHLAELARATSAAEGWSVTLCDLYAMGFDPCERAEHYAPRRDPGRFDVQAEQHHASTGGAIPGIVATRSSGSTRPIF